MHHHSPISGIAASSDGQFVATAGYDNQLILWDSRYRNAVSRSFHDHLANQCAFSPDNTLLATASSDHTARLWSVPELKLQTVFATHDDDVEMVAFSHRGDRIATASRDHKVRVFLVSGRLLATMVGHKADVISVAWSADDSEVTSSSDDGTVKLWDAQNGHLKNEFDMKGVETDTLAIAHDGTIFAGDDEGAISIISCGQVAKMPAHKVGIKRLVLGNERLVSLSYDRTFSLWDIDYAGRKLTRVLSSEMPPVVWPRSCAFLGTRQVIFGTFGTSYATFDLITRDWDLTDIGATGGVNAVACVNGSVLTIGDAGVLNRDKRAVRELGSLCNFLTPFGTVVLTGGQLGRVFDALTGTPLYVHHSPLNCGAVFTSGGASKAIVGTYTGEAIVFGTDSAGNAVFESIVKLHSNAIKGIACDASTIFSVCATGAAAWHSSHDLSMIRIVEHAHDKIANGCAVLANQGFVSISRDRKLRTWTSKGCLVEAIETPHTHSIKCVAASVDGRLVATASYNGRVAVYNRRTCVWVYDCRLTASGVSSLTATSTGFLAGAYDGHVYSIAV